MMEPSLLSVHGLRKSFGSLTAVDGLDLEVRDGDIYGLLGLNGAGKTTALRMIVGLLRPSGGRVCLFGRDADPRRPRDRMGIGALVEGPAFFGRLSARRNLELLGRLQAEVSDDEIETLLHDVGIAAAADRKVADFSLGMRQRLGIALALVGRPRLVILDEPSNGLDPRGMADIRDLIRRRNAEHGVTFVISSHLLHEVQQLATRVGIVRRGRLVAQGTLEELLDTGTPRLRVKAEPVAGAAEVLRAHPAVRRVTEEANGVLLAEIDDASAASAINRALVESGVAVSALSSGEPSLEELFLARAEVAA